MNASWLIFLGCIGDISNDNEIPRILWEIWGKSWNSGENSRSNKATNKAVRHNTIKFTIFKMLTEHKVSLVSSADFLKFNIFSSSIKKKIEVTAVNLIITECVKTIKTCDYSSEHQENVTWYYYDYFFQFCFEQDRLNAFDDYFSELFAK